MSGQEAWNKEMLQTAIGEVVAGDDRIAALTAENERLRAEVDHTHIGMTRAMDRAFHLQTDLDAMRLALSALTVDAAAECGRLRAERDEAVALLHGCAPEVKP